MSSVHHYYYVNQGKLESVDLSSRWKRFLRRTGLWYRNTHLNKVAHDLNNYGSNRLTNSTLSSNDTDAIKKIKKKIKHKLTNRRFFSYTKEQAKNFIDSIFYKYNSACLKTHKTRYSSKSILERLKKRIKDFSEEEIKTEFDLNIECARKYIKKNWQNRAMDIGAHMEKKQKRRITEEELTNKIATLITRINFWVRDHGINRLTDEEILLGKDAEFLDRNTIFRILDTSSQTTVKAYIQFDREDPFYALKVYSEKEDITNNSFELLKTDLSEIKGIVYAVEIENPDAPDELVLRMDLFDGDLSSRSINSEASLNKIYKTVKSTLTKIHNRGFIHHCVAPQHVVVSNTEDTEDMDIGLISFTEIKKKGEISRRTNLYYSPITFWNIFIDCKDSLHDEWHDMFGLALTLASQIPDLSDELEELFSIIQAVLKVDNCDFDGETVEKNIKFLKTLAPENLKSNFKNLENILNANENILDPNAKIEDHLNRDNLNRFMLFMKHYCYPLYWDRLKKLQEKAQSLLNDEKSSAELKEVLTFITQTLVPHDEYVSNLDSR